MTTLERRRRIRRIGAVVGSLALLVIASGIPAPASAGTRSLSTGATAGWAYGGNRSVSVSGASGTGVYSLTAHVGYEVLLNSTTRPDGTVQLELQRTSGALLTFSFCAPDCARSIANGQVVYHTFERLTGFANLTPNSTVEENGTAVAAWGLLSSAVELRAAAYENDSGSRLLGSELRSGRLALSLHVAENVSVAFTPALGLLPISRSPGDRWNSTASYAASGSWSASYDLSRVAGGVVDSRTGAPSGSASAAGPVQLSGADLGPLSLRDGRGAEVVRWGLSGPFHLREGFVLVPESSDLLGAGRASVLPQGNGTLSDSFDTLDVAAGSSGPTGYVASSASYLPASNSPTAATPVAGPSPSSGPSNVLVQAQPESTSSAIRAGPCALEGGCSGTSSSGGGRVEFVVLLILGVAALASVGAAVALQRRPRAPPRANPALYPPVVPPAVSRGGGTPRAPVPPPPSEDEENDPLSHLW